MSDVLLILPGSEGDPVLPAGDDGHIRCLHLPRLRPGDPLPPDLALEKARDIEGQGTTILVADLACGDALAHLREQGYRALRAGNRLYGADATPEAISAVSGATLCEQVTEKQADASEAWRRDGWAGLSAQGIEWPQALKIAASNGSVEPCLVRRLDDLTLMSLPAKGQTSDPERWRIQPSAEAEHRWNGSHCQEVPNPADRDPTDYDQARCRGRPVEPTPALVLYQEGANPRPANTRAIEFLGPRSRDQWLGRLLCDAALSTCWKLELTLGFHRCRFVARRRPGVADSAVDLLVSRLLEVILVTGRPLREVDCTLHLPLDLHLDQEVLEPQPEGLEGLADGQSRETLQINEHTLNPDAADVLAAVIDGAGSPEQRALLYRARLASLPGRDETEASLAESQALLYFLPALRARIFHQRDASTQQAAVRGTLRHWRIDPAQLQESVIEVEIAAEPAEGGPLPTRARAAVKDISLFGYANHLFILSLRLGFTPEQDRLARCFSGDGRDWWHGLFGWEVVPGPGWADRNAASGCQSPDPRELQAEHWLALIKGARLLRPAFPQQRMEGKLGQVSLRFQDVDETFAHQPFSPIITALLKQLTGLDFTRPPHDSRLMQIRDDRMVVNAAYALAGPPPGDDPEARAGFERLFSLGLYVDRGSDGFATQGGFAYDRDFVRQQLQAQVNRRWQAVGSLYGTTNYSHVGMGCGDYFAGPVARVHMPYIHERMLLLVLFHDLTLSWLDRGVTLLSVELQELGRSQARDPAEALRRAGERLAAFERRFLIFTNDHWLREVTSQTQGQELYRRMGEAFGLEEHYRQVKAKIERTHDFVAQLRGQALAEQAHAQAVAAHAQTRLSTRLAAVGNDLNRKAGVITRVAILVAVAAMTIGALAIPTDHAETRFWSACLLIALGLVAYFVLANKSLANRKENDHRPEGPST